MLQMNWHYLKRDNAGNYGKCSKHDTIYWGNNFSIEHIQSLKHKRFVGTQKQRH